jgi:hypothetical protein
MTEKNHYLNFILFTTSINTIPTTAAHEAIINAGNI